MRTIWKFNITDRPTVLMPDGAEVLTVQTQRGEVMIWAIVDPDRPLEPRRFVICGTGQPMPDDVGHYGRYVGTWQSHGGSFVFHLFEDVGQ